MSDVRIERLADQGMITIRGDLDAPEFTKALSLTPPKARQITGGDVPLAWMSPDELLALCPNDAVAGHIARLSKALEGQHHLLADVSDARAVFRLIGEDRAVREVLAKLSPADLRPESLPHGEIRRTRLAQIAAAFWLDADGATLICFRSVARYAEDILKVSCRDRVGHF